MVKSSEIENNGGKGGFNKKTALILAVILVSLAVLGGGGAGIFFALTSYKLDTPEVTLSFSGESDYLITLAWAPVEKAVSYKIEYSYDYFPGQTYAITVTSNFFSVKRIKGGFTYKIKAFGERAKNDSGAAAAKVEIPALEFDSLNIFNVTETGGSYKIDYNSFEPVRYIYKGNNYEVPSYEAVFFSQGASEQEKAIKFAAPEVWTSEEIKDATFNFTKGEWKIYVRPVPYYMLFTDKTVAGIEYLDQLYSAGEYTVVTVTVE